MSAARQPDPDRPRYSSAGRRSHLRLIPAGEGAPALGEHPAAAARGILIGVAISGIAFWLPLAYLVYRLLR